MKKFKYTAVNLQRKKVTGIFLAEDEQELAMRLAEQNLYLVKAKQITQTTASTFFSTTGKVSANELATFCRQFAIMFNTGISIVDSLEILKNQSYSGLLKKTLEFLHEDVKAGQLLSQALEKHKKIFPRFLLSMIYVGEISGALDKILITLADYFETDASIKKKTKSAMIYPVILIFMAIGIIVLMVAFIIPTFMEALGSLDVEMPPLTIALYNTSVWFRTNWKMLFLVIFAIVMLFMLWKRTASGKVAWDGFKFKAPIIGKVVKSLVTARFARAFGLLIDGGLDVIDAMETSKIVLGNKYVEKKFEQAINDVKQGLSITEALDGYKIFPPLIIQMISVGEKSGSLAEVLIRSCSFFDNQAEVTISSMTTIIQPIILAIIGGSVGVLFYAIYSPLLQVMENIGV
ncbi:MAG TPA: type II secretion system F family protein [Candidatus Limihabitans stercoravium]|nr:type II secretion system F family protein [Candidatus Limihabitans stercoravium]